MLRTYTILTTDPNELMEPIHNRMPVIIPPKEYERWMAPTDPAHLPVDLLRAYPAEEMKAWKVGKAVGNTRNNDASLVEPLKENETIPTTLPLFE
jgi:putative SOS response-associated peptidase YedK